MTPKYVRGLKNLNIFSYEAIMNGDISEEELEEYDISPKQFKYAKEAIADKAVKICSPEQRKIPEGYKYCRAGKIDGSSFVVFMKHNIKFDFSY